MQSHGRSARRILTAIGTLLVWIALTPAAAPAVRMDASTSTAAYLQAVAKTPDGDEFENRTRLFERIRVNVRDLGSPAFSFHTFLTARYDASNDAIGDVRTRIYHGYFQAQRSTGPPGALRGWARLGRQWVSAGVGSGTIDGLAVQAERSGWGAIRLFGGTLGAERREGLQIWTIDDPKDSRRLGGELTIHPRLREAFVPEISTSFSDTRRNDVQESQRIGGRLSLQVRRQLRLWTEVRHDLLLDRTYGTSTGAEFLKLRGTLRAWAEYNRRTAVFPENSFFASFDPKPVSELRGGLGLGLGGPYRATFDFTRSDFKGGTRTVTVGDSVTTRTRVDRSTGYRAVLHRGAFSVGGRFQGGFGGDRASILLAGQHPVTPKLHLQGSIGYEDYDHGDGWLVDNTATTAILRAAYEVRQDTDMTIQVEGLRNRDLKRDLRLLLQVDKRFRTGR